MSPTAANHDWRSSMPGPDGAPLAGRSAAELNRPKENPMARKLFRNTLVMGAVAAILGAGLATSAVAGADATDDYPSPTRF